jgi:hypothetical protein
MGRVAGSHYVAVRGQEDAGLLHDRSQKWGALGDVERHALCARDGARVTYEGTRYVIEVAPSESADNPKPVIAVDYGQRPRQCLPLLPL